MSLTARFATSALFLGFIALFAFSLPGTSLGQDRTPRGERIPNQYIVVLKDSVENVDAAENDLVGKVRGVRLSSYRSAIKGFSARFSEAELAGIASDPRVAFVSEDREVFILNSTNVRSSSHRSRGDTPPPTPPPPESPPTTPPDSSPEAEAVSAQSQTLPTGINRINAEGKANKGAGVHVAVIDTGIQTSHPDLKDNIAGGKNCSTGTSYNDGNGHGTHVAGTIAALNNNAGVVGVAPEAKLWAVRVLNNRGGGT